MTPKALKIIVRPSGFRKDMDNEISVVQQDPLRDIIAFGAERKLAQFLQLLGDFICYCVRLARVSDGADDEKLCKGSNFTKIKDPKINGFFGFSGANGRKPVWQLFARGGWWGVFETVRQTR
jgi:hypothetical protein